jgi:cytoskeletal protein RodZ
MASLGQDLKRERELRSVSLEDMAEQTKINIRFLRALEEDRLDLLPGGFFVKAILRTYSRSIGIDENAALNKYQEDILFGRESDTSGRAQADVRPPAQKPEASLEKILRPAKKARVKDKRDRIFWTIAAAVAVAFLALVTAVYLLFLRPKPIGRPGPKAPAAAQAEKPSTSTVPSSAADILR